MNICLALISREMEEEECEEEEKEWDEKEEEEEEEEEDSEEEGELFAVQHLQVNDHLQNNPP